MSFNQYDAFADDFARTRSRPWDFMVTFMQELTDLGLLRQYNLGLDVGCGNGQNAILFQKNTLNLIGLDLSWMLLRKARNKYSHVVNADLNALPFREDIFDFGMCVAVLHHILGRDARQQAVRGMKRVMKPGGDGIVTVWRRWQDRFHKIFLYEGFHNAELYFPAGRKDFGDIDIGWGESTSQTRHPRLYHLFTRAELRNLLAIFQILLLKVAGHKNSKTNYIAFIQK